MYRLIMLLASLWLIAAAACATPPAEPRGTTIRTQRDGAAARTLAAPANRRASADARRLLTALQVPRDGCGVIVGQNIGSGEIVQTAYDQLIAGLQHTTGRAPALVGLDYYDFDDDHHDYAASHPPLLEHWRAGGLITISWSAINPWTGGDAWDLRQANLVELLDPSSAAHQVWMVQLAAIADALGELRDAGVIVLWRPLHEMNGNWFWWGSGAHAGDPAPYRALWRHMFQYFSEDRGLDNLLWVYSAAGTEPSLPAADAFYPGADVVDIVAQSVYDGTLQRFEYDRLEALGKPVALGEFGPGLPWMGPQDGDYDYRRLLDLIAASYPQTIYWLSWHDWVENGATVAISIAANRHADDLMNAQCATTRDELDWRETPPESLSPPERIHVPMQRNGACMPTSACVQFDRAAAVPERYWVAACRRQSVRCSSQRRHPPPGSIAAILAMS
jgi:mannan endo-1,4-beta-mannosidase